MNQVTEATYKEWTRRAVPKAKDLILAREAPVGNLAIIAPNLKVCLGQRTVLIRPDKNKVDPDFLLYLLLGDQIQAKLQSLSNGVTVGHLNVQDIRSLLLPELPSLLTQGRVAAILCSYDDLIENNTRRIKILEEMAQALYREWFVHFRFPGHEKVKMVPSSLGPIPQGWSVALLAELANINARSIQSAHEPEEIAYIDISSVSTGSISRIEQTKFDNAPSRAKRIVRHGDIIWSSVRPNRKSYSLILDPAPNLIVSTGFAVISGTNAPFTYLYHALTTDSFVGYLTNHAKGAAYPAVSAQDFEQAKILRPSGPCSIDSITQRSRCLDCGKA